MYLVISLAGRLPPCTARNDGDRGNMRSRTCHLLRIYINLKLVEVCLHIIFSTQSSVPVCAKLTVCQIVSRSSCQSLILSACQCASRSADTAVLVHLVRSCAPSVFPTIQRPYRPPCYPIFHTHPTPPHRPPPTLHVAPPPHPTPPHTAGAEAQVKL